MNIFRKGCGNIFTKQYELGSDDIRSYFTDTKNRKLFDVLQKLFSWCFYLCVPCLGFQYLFFSFGSTIWKLYVAVYYNACSQETTRWAIADLTWLVAVLAWVGGRCNSPMTCGAPPVLLHLLELAFGSGHSHALT